MVRTYGARMTWVSHRLNERAIEFYVPYRISSLRMRRRSPYPETVRGSTVRRFVRLAVPPGNTTTIWRRHVLNPVRGLQNFKSPAFRQLAWVVHAGGRRLP